MITDPPKDEFPGGLDQYVVMVAAQMITIFDKLQRVRKYNKTAEFSIMHYNAKKINAMYSAQNPFKFTEFTLSPIAQKPTRITPSSS